FLFTLNQLPFTTLYTLSLHDALPISLRTLEIRGRHDARHDGNGDTGLAHLFKKAHMLLRIEHELRHRARGASIDLALQQFDISLERRRLWMFFRIGRNNHLEVGDLAAAFDQFRR